ncbi:MAG: hypothetical protein QOC74_4063, partial [Pseudonocardiales bacterium]|nr:hypothetical protein [Pseudonocardiales bacterium]
AMAADLAASGTNSAPEWIGDDERCS